MATISGFITRSNLPTPLANLPIAVDPYNLIMGDNSDSADTSTHAGITPAQSTLKSIWADSPYVRGKQLVLATPDNSTLDLRLLVHSTVSFGDLESKVSDIITAIRGQLSFEVSISFDAWVSAWACYTGDYLVAFNQIFLFGGWLCPVYLTLPRDPTPLVGPI